MVVDVVVEVVVFVVVVAEKYFERNDVKKSVAHSKVLNVKV